MKDITSAQFETEVFQSTIPVLVDFYTDNCGPCRLMAPVIEEIEKESGGKLKVVKMDAAADPGFTGAFRITSAPTFLLFRKGQQIAQMAGAKSKKDMTKWIAESLR